MSQASLFDRVKSWLLYPLPHLWLSRCAFALTRLHLPPVHTALIRFYIRLFDVDMQAAEQPDPGEYQNISHFFTRSLKPGLRPIDPDPKTILSPVDGTVSQCGYIEKDQLLQAKGKQYSLSSLLGDEELATAFMNGRFTTLYLSPRDYHRVHMPVTGTLREMITIPGRLFSVAAHTTRAINNLFTRNERLVMIFDTDTGPMALIMVGALFVGGIETVWHGVVTPPHTGKLRHYQYEQAEHPIHLEKGAELGRFNMGSTVILLYGAEHIEWLAEHQPDAAIRMGQVIGHKK